MFIEALFKYSDLHNEAYQPFEEFNVPCPVYMSNKVIATNIVSNLDFKKLNRDMNLIALDAKTASSICGITPPIFLNSFFSINCRSISMNEVSDLPSICASLIGMKFSEWAYIITKPFINCSGQSINLKVKTKSNALYIDSYICESPQHLYYPFKSNDKLILSMK